MTATAKKKPGRPVGSKVPGTLEAQIVFRLPADLKRAAEERAAPGRLSEWMVTLVRRAVGKP